MLAVFPTKLHGNMFPKFQRRLSLSPSTKNLLWQDPPPTLPKAGFYRRDHYGPEGPGRKLTGQCELAMVMFAGVFSIDLSSNSLVVSSAVSNLLVNPVTKF